MVTRNSVGDPHLYWASLRVPPSGAIIALLAYRHGAWGVVTVPVFAFLLVRCWRMFLVLAVARFFHGNTMPDVLILAVFLRWRLF